MLGHSPISAAPISGTDRQGFYIIHVEALHFTQTFYPVEVALTGSFTVAVETLHFTQTFFPVEVFRTHTAHVDTLHFTQTFYPVAAWKSRANTWTGRTF